MKKGEKIFWTVFVVCLIANLINIYFSMTTEPYFVTTGRALMLMLVSMISIEAIGALILVWTNEI